MPETIRVTHAFDPVRKRFALIALHGSPAAFKSAHRQFRNPADTTVNTVYEKVWTSLVIPTHHRYHSDEAYTEALTEFNQQKSIYEAEVKAFLIDSLKKILCDIYKNIPPSEGFPFIDFLVYADMNLGYSGETQFPEFLESKKFILWISEYFFQERFSPLELNFHFLLISGSPSIVGAKRAICDQHDPEASDYIATSLYEKGHENRQIKHLWEEPWTETDCPHAIMIARPIIQPIAQEPMEILEEQERENISPNTLGAYLESMRVEALESSSTKKRNILESGNEEPDDLISERKRRKPTHESSIKPSSWFFYRNKRIAPDNLNTAEKIPVSKPVSKSTGFIFSRCLRNSEPKQPTTSYKSDETIKAGNKPQFKLRLFSSRDSYKKYLPFQRSDAPTVDISSTSSLEKIDGETFKPRRVFS